MRNKISAENEKDATDGTVHSSRRLQLHVGEGGNGVGLELPISRVGKHPTILGCPSKRKGMRRPPPVLLSLINRAGDKRPNMGELANLANGERNGHQFRVTGLNGARLPIFK